MVKDLTVGERDQIKSTISAEALDILSKHRVYKMNSEFLTSIFSADDKWEFLGMNENPMYGTPDNNDSLKLYCECGLELRYQYVIKSKNNDEVKTLGVTHFEQHTGVPPAVANKVRSGLQRIDRWLDDILIQYPTYQDDKKQQTAVNIFKTADADLMKSFNSNECAMINDFIDVGLPLPTPIIMKAQLLDTQYKNKELSSLAPNDTYSIDYLKLRKAEIARKKQLTEQVQVASGVIRRAFSALTNGDGLDSEELKKLIVDSASFILDECTLDEAMYHIDKEINKKTYLKIKQINNRYYKIY